MSVTPQRADPNDSEEAVTRRIQLLKNTVDLYRRKSIPNEDILPYLTQDFASVIHYLRYPDVVQEYIHGDEAFSRLFELLTTPSPVSSSYVPFSPS